MCSRSRPPSRAAALPSGDVGTIAGVIVPAIVLTALSLVTTGPTQVSVPAVSGVARVGSSLLGTQGSWSSSSSMTFTYQWSRCDANGGSCAPIAGATTGVYALAAADSGKTVYLTVTATDSTGKATADSALVGPIAASNATLASTVRPGITGTTTLTASNGTWTTTPTSYAYQWLRCDTHGRTCSVIAGATSASYTPVAAADGGHRLVASVSAKAGSATQAVLSAPSALVAGGSTPPPPTTTLPRPTVAGSPRQGQRLTATPPPGTAATATFAYQWYRCDATGAHCLSIHGATAKTYLQVAKDAGKTIGLTVKVTDGGTTTPTYASLVGPVAAAAAPASTVQPAVTGQAMQSQTLSVTAGTWTATPAKVSYAWQRCNANGRICLAIDGATSATYVPTAADVGHSLTALVLATIGSSTATAFSTASDPIKAAGLANTAPPAVGGLLRVGQKLTGTTGTWTGIAPIAYHYQWYRCDANGAHCASVHGSTKSTYTLVAKDVGHTMGLTVTATDSSGSKAAYASLAGPIAAKASTFTSSLRPTITGTAVVGKALTASAGLWTTTPTSTSFQWERCNQNGRICAPIAGATAASYTPVAADVGHALLAVVAAKAGTLSASTFSVATAPVAS